MPSPRSGYQVQWITDHLAVGHAPMSYDDLHAIRDQGIDAIVNLCGEFCDLHDIEKESGFDVLYFPIEDDSAPNLQEMERALDWLDEAIYLGKKVLVHCRLGIGRTGTFVTSYLLRRGYGLRLARKTLKHLRAAPTSYYQWRLLRRYGKQEGKLSIREPSLESKNLVDLGPFFAEYESVAREIDQLHRAVGLGRPEGLASCGDDTDGCCGNFLMLQLIEATYLHYQASKYLVREDRQAAIARAAVMHRIYCRGAAQLSDQELLFCPLPEGKAPTEQAQEVYRCPLSVERKCIVYPHRPLACRLFGLPVLADGSLNFGELGPLPSACEETGKNLVTLKATLARISRQLFFALNSTFMEKESFIFPLTHVVSGKFVQDYFNFLATL